MSLLTVIVTLVVLGIILWAINTYGSSIIDPKFIKLINVVIVIVAIIWLLNVFGILGAMNVSIPRAH